MIVDDRVGGQLPALELSQDAALPCILASFDVPDGDLVTGYPSRIDGLDPLRSDHIFDDPLYSWNLEFLQNKRSK